MTRVDAVRGGHRVTRRQVRIAVVTGSVVVLVVGYLFARPESARSVSVAEALDRADSGADSGAEGDARPARPADTDRLVPAAGVYRYRGSGTETLEQTGTSQSQGPDMPGTVTHGSDGCWTFRIDYSTKHHQTWDYCSSSVQMVERGGTTRQRLSLIVTDIEVSSVTTCSSQVVAVDLEARPDEFSDQVCEATSTGSSGVVVTSGTNRFVGDEEVRIDGVDIAAVHYRRERSLSGGQSGTETVDLWFARDSGLPLKNRRQVEVRTTSPIGELTYREEGSFELVSTVPTER